MAPRYKPRSAYKSRHSSGEVDSHPELQGTTLDRPVFGGEVVESTRETANEPMAHWTADGELVAGPAPESEAEALGEPEPPPSRLQRHQALMWAPLIWLVCVGLGGFVGALVAMLD